MKPQIRNFWRSFEQSAGADAGARFYEAFHFDDNEPSANELAALVLAGVKRATAGLLWALEADRKVLPKRGDLSVMTDWGGTPLCVIETQLVEIVPYEAVTSEFAAIEGEGDGSLRFWREAHWAYFGRECARIGRTRDPRMPVVCEQFEVVYRG
ncbi:MAG TPA: ASCH domain-containing protein [Burkholderiales bacterium]|nr:ASCH domain-containing protein [Burkholderiales bacterium]